MYHDVLDARAADDGIPKAASLYHVPLDAFREHLRILSSAGSAVRTVGDYVGGADGRSGGSILLTFDDGWARSLSLGVECLLAEGLRATFFVTRDYVGKAAFA